MKDHKSKESLQLEEASTQWTGGITTGLEITIHTLIVEALLAYATLHPWKREVSLMDNGLTNSTLLHTFKFLL